MMKDKIHFVSYGDNKFKIARQRIYNEALNTNWFHSIKCYDKEDLSTSFKKKFKNILSMKRGGGYWIWKFDIIINKLKEIDNEEFLIYVDSGCTINSNGSKRLNEYIEMIKNNKNKIISFQMHHHENVWTTKQIFDSFNISENDPIQTSGQYIGGVLIMQKCDAVIKMFEDCLNKITKDPLIITDSYNKNQRKVFKDNRHDQSILSIARKIHGSIILSDETIDDDGKNYNFVKDKPFLATRKKN